MMIVFLLFDYNVLFKDIAFFNIVMHIKFIYSVFEREKL